MEERRKQKHFLTASFNSFRFACYAGNLQLSVFVGVGLPNPYRGFRLIRGNLRKGKKRPIKNPKQKHPLVTGN